MVMSPPSITRTIWEKRVALTMAEPGSMTSASMRRRTPFSRSKVVRTQVPGREASMRIPVVEAKVILVETPLIKGPTASLITSF